MCACVFCDLLQPLKPEVVFRVQPAYYELANKVAASINQAINNGQSEQKAAAEQRQNTANDYNRWFGTLSNACGMTELDVEE